MPKPIYSDYFMRKYNAHKEASFLKWLNAGKLNGRYYFDEQ